MKTLKEIQEYITHTIQHLDWNKAPRGLYEPIEYTLEGGGKRVRPALLLLTASMYNANLEEATAAAMAVEIFHNFTLLHDDVMDKSDTRRGRKTVHIKWNENTAILSGDQMMIEAYSQIAKLSANKLKIVLPLFNKMATEICEGQQYDVDFETQDDVTIPEYTEMIRLKTAVLLATALKIGSLLGNADETEAQALYDFGINIGLAFQIKDDYLDVYGDEKTLGKTIGGDILCGKKTYMWLSAWKNAGEDERRELMGWLHNQEAIPSEKIHAVRNIYTKVGASKECEVAMEEYHQKAVAELDKIDKNGDKTQELRNLAENLMGRNN